MQNKVLFNNVDLEDILGLNNLENYKTSSIVFNYILYKYLIEITLYPINFKLIKIFECNKNHIKAYFSIL